MIQDGGVKKPSFSSAVAEAVEEAAAAEIPVVELAIEFGKKEIKEKKGS